MDTEFWLLFWAFVTGSAVITGMYVPFESLPAFLWGVFAGRSGLLGHLLVLCLFFEDLSDFLAYSCLFCQMTLASTHLVHKINYLGIFSGLTLNLVINLIIWTWWCTPVIPATRELEIGRITGQSQPKK
jgi:hypothetical protein